MCLRLASLLAACWLAQLTHAAAPPPRTDRHGDPLPPGAVTRLGTVRFHRPHLLCAAFSPDGRHLVTGDYHGYLAVWDARTGKELRYFKGHGNYICSIVFSPDGRLMATASNLEPDVVRLWDFATGKEVRRFKGQPTAGDDPALSFSPDGTVLAAGGRMGPVSVWDVATGTLRRSLDQPSSDRLKARDVLFSPDGKLLATCDLEGAVYLWDTATWKVARTLKGHSREIVGLAFAPDSKRLVSACGDKAVRVWETAAGKQLSGYRKDLDLADGLALARDGKVVVALTQRDGAHAWETATGKPVWQSKAVACTSLACWPKGDAVAAVTDWGILLWDGAMGRRLNPTREPAGWVSQLSYSPDGTALAASYDSGEVRLWRPASGEELARGTAPHTRFFSLRAGPKGRVLAAAGPREDGVGLVDVFARKTLGWLAEGGWSAAIAPEGDHVVACTPGGLLLWHPASGKVLRRYTPDGESPRTIALSPDGQVLAGAGEEGLRLWDVSTATPLGRFGMSKGDAVFVAFSPDGRGVLSKGQAPRTPGRDLYLWEAATGKLRLCLKGQVGNITAAVISPDCRLLATASHYDGVQLWDLATGEQVGRAAGHKGGVDALAFSPDGRTLATGGQDTTVLVWDVGRIAPVRRAPAAKLTDQRLEELWGELTHHDVERAYRAVWALAEQAGKVEPFLKRKLEAAPRPSPARLRRLVAELDSDVFATRDNATRELERLGHAARPALLEGLRRGPSLEVSLRLGRLLRQMSRTSPGPEEIRTSRALEVLHRVGTPEARRLLEAYGTAGKEAGR